MGESRWFKVEIETSGAFTYRGFRNVEHLGDHVGRVNYLCLDHILSVINSIGIERALTNKESDVLATTGGDWSIAVRTTTDSYEFACNGDDMSATFWCVWRLIELLLANADWGQGAFDSARLQPYADSFTNRRTAIPPLGPGTGERYF